MLRIVLTGYLTIFTAAGPVLCCCTTLRGLAPCADRRGTAETAPAAGCGCCAAEPPASCCAEQAGCCSTPSPKSPKAPQRSCPCKQVPAGCCLEAPPFAAPNDSSLLRWAVHVAYDLPALGGTFELPSPAVPALPDALVAGGPFWAANDLLHVQHRLRC
jgi:hypothetical protein